MHVMTIISLVVFGAVVYSWHYYGKSKSPLQKFFFPALGFKLFCGIVLGFLYKYYYQYGDTWIYFNEATKLADLFWQDRSNYFSLLWSNTGIEKLGMSYVSHPRALFMVKILSIINIATGSNYWMSSLYLSLFSFIGCWTLAINLVRNFPQLKSGIVVGLLFYPSVVFWGAGIVKESVAIGTLMLCLTCFVNIIYGSKKSGLHLLCFAVFFVLLWKLKYYVAAVLALVIIPTFVMLYLKRIFTIQKSALSWLAILVVVGVVITQIHPNFYLGRFVAVVVDNHNQYLLHTQNGGIILYNKLAPTIPSLLLNSPLAVISAWFRPFVFEATNVPQLILSVENLLLLVWVIGGAVYFRKAWSKQHLYITMSVLVFIILLSTFLALSTPNFGTLSRYRIMFVPFMLIITGHTHNWAIRKLKVFARSLKIL